MIKNYLKAALRNISRHKGYSFINFFGLSLGMACFIMMFLWIQNELGFDHFNENIEEIYRAAIKDYKGDKITHYVAGPAPLGPALVEEFPEFLNYARYFPIEGRWPLKINGESIEGLNICVVDPPFFKMFTYPLIKGDPGTALSHLESIVISEDMSRKYYANQDPMEAFIGIYRKNYKVTGVMKNVPLDSHLQFDCVIPFGIWESWSKEYVSWEYDSYATYLLVQKNTDIAQLNRKIAGLLKKYRPNSNLELYLQPLKDIHLRSNFKWNMAVTSKITYIYILYVLAFFILFSACLNFMNLATARAGSRFKEVGMRKVVGARRIDLIKQFFGESILFAFLSLIFAIVLVILFQPIINQYSIKPITLLSLGFFQVIGILILLTFITGILSGIYPALFLSSFEPVKVMKGTQGMGHSSSLFRKILVIGQITITAFLIIGAVVIYKQLHYMRTKDLGYEKENVILFTALGDFHFQYDVYKNELLANPNILSVTRGFEPCVAEINSKTPHWQGKLPGEDIRMQCYNVNYDYFKTYKMEMKEGRTFSKEFSTDASAAFVLNERAIKAMGMKSPIGKKISIEDDNNEGRIEGIIIGVVKDFHHSSLQTEIQPIIFKMGLASSIAVRVRPGGPEVMAETLKFLENMWEKAKSGYQFKPRFLDEVVDNFYKNEKQLLELFNYFTFLVIFISCLGLFGLAFFMVERRTKEIGIRKVLGATISKILLLLSKEFILLVIMANIIAWPVIYIVANKWLQNFAYRIPLEWWFFLITAAATMLITLLTVSYQTLRAALANPVDTLRYE
jgi:ABC-type antimicrobial peptide transport system permease subunit